ncbi:DUF2264 domain-containing protein [Aliiglaciecola sp. CAU 1673]|uniref:DUF2264 domain-containing protein n=1 Tax=Aliiglaciecola sp. CAU 1673 TaxID=3032595 RepID=UPI0023D9A948|nr:DUF2264 domain-containing protein [Aliiglaciecola sp. CAU 1673]MDF2177301.1 DUF2264 domain-containing protein [Aliiglaciecola sp. CAU 1673]
MIGWQDLQRSVAFRRQQWRRWRLSRQPFAEMDAAIQSAFSSTELSVSEKLEQLVEYFWTAHRHYRHPLTTRVYYPGLGSIYGPDNDGFEGMSRLLPLWAAYICSPHAKESLSAEMTDYMLKVLRTGTDKTSDCYWGDIGHKSTLICEAADIALGLWLGREKLWPALTEKEKHNVLQWLKQVSGKQTADNNWHLFVVLTEKVIEALEPGYKGNVADRYNRIKSFYLGQGCFKDGENGHVDLYNPWCFHYILYWLDRIDPGFDPDFIKQAICDYSRWFRYLFTSEGCPLFGRSLCYRMAMPTPVLAAHHYAPDEFSAGECLNIFYSCWAFFVANGALKLGKPTQGVFADDERWLDPYSGPASSFWATRSLVLYLHLADEVPWSTTALQALPAEREEVELDIPEAGIKIETRPKQQLSRVIFTHHHGQFDAGRLACPSLKDKIRQCLLGGVQRPANNLLKQEVRVFDSRLEYYRRKRVMGSIY